MTPLHAWNVSTAEAREIQERLRDRVRIEPLAGPVRTVAGADISFDKKAPTLFAAIVVLDAASGAVLETRGLEAPVTFPYVPGYLSFREVPPLLAVWETLEQKPDLVICDGQGLAHPRRMGLACHLGVWIDVPTLGCGKSRLVGEYEEPGMERGAVAPLLHDGAMVGEVVRTRTRVKPLFVSPGHRITQAEARAWVLRLATPYRQPNTTRLAHREVNRLRREAKGGS